MKQSRVVATLMFMLIGVGIASCGSPPSPTATGTPTPVPATGTPVVTPIAMQTPTWTPIPGSANSLRAAAEKRGLHIGAAINSSHLFSEQEYMDTLGREFNMFTPETEMKFDQISPERGKYNFETADRIVAFAEANRMAIRGHALVWHLAIPAWVANGKFSRDETINILHEYISTMVGHYKGRIYQWDVVNEGVYDDGRFRRSLWLDEIGPEYIEMAFRWAHEADPAALLFYNDYSLDDLNTKSNAVYRLAKDLRAKGVPWDGIGFQMHIRADAYPRPGSVKANMERFAALGMVVQITELDVSTHYVFGAPEARLKKQAQTYHDMAATCLSVNACLGVVTWGITDKYTWLHDFYGPDDRPLLFDESYKPKPAYDALLAVLNNGS
jgi:endo-1,4-beta-xylanase